MLRRLAYVLTIVLGLHTFDVSAERFDRIDVELLSEVTSVQPGEPFWIGVHLRPDDGWGTYWKNPGEAGLPTRIEWDAGSGGHTSDTQWPFPDRIEAQGVASYGYYEDVLLLSRVTPSEHLRPGDELSLSAEVSWAVCSDICILGDGSFQLTLPVSGGDASVAPQKHQLFEDARSRLPREPDAWDSTFVRRNDTIRLRIQADGFAAADWESAEFFPASSRILEESAGLRNAEITDQGIRLTGQISRNAPDDLHQISGVAVLRSAAGGTEAYSVRAYAATDDTGSVMPATTSAAPGDYHLLIALLMAFAGGIILNTMPCVFPVLSFKAVVVMESPERGQHTHQMHGLFYALGVISFFLALGGVFYAISAKSETIGWGFQLHSPWFVGLLAYILFTRGLNFSGVLSFGNRLMGVGQSLTESGGYVGSYFTGALAAVVATPCTAPFMGAAIAYALVQPPLHALTVFAALGAGMALPFVLLVSVPGLGRLLPKPGPWMVVMKQALAFPLYLTVIWLLWVVGQQTGPMGMAILLGGLLLICFVAWLQNLPRGQYRFTTTLAGRPLAAVAIIGALGLLALPTMPPIDRTPGAATTNSEWQRYSAERLERLVAEGQPVFLNVTADWCISCIANERTTLSATTVKNGFSEAGVALMEADWTRPDPEITRLLDRFNRKGIPLYVLFPGSGPDGNPREPVVLPTILTPGIVLDALESIETDNTNQAARPTSP